MSDSLFGVPFKVDTMLVGSKRAVMLDGVILVSPAMYELITACESSEELERLLGNIPMLNLGRTFTPFFPLPMTTEAPR